MSAVFGLFNKDGRSVDAAELKAMQRELASWGPDGTYLWEGGMCGLGQNRLFSTPESRYEDLPRHIPEAGVAFTASARLDNRDDLCRALSIPPAEGARNSDGDLLIQAYLRWGGRCTDYVFGDWALAAWSAVDRRLFLARDRSGATALYYYDCPDFFAFASSQRALRAVPRVVAPLNEVRLAQSLVHWEGDLGTTMYRRIRYLRPAHTVLVTLERCLEHRYWSLADGPEIRFATSDEYADGLRDALDRAVEARSRSFRDVGLSLSSGLDSGGIAALAAPHVRKGGTGFHSYTAIPVQGTHSVPSGRYGDESELARELARHVGIDHDHYSDFSSEGILEVIRRGVSILDSPLLAWSNSPWLLGIPAMASRHGVGVLLDGWGGNATASWKGELSSQPLWLALKYDWRQTLKSHLRKRIPHALARKVRRRFADPDFWKEFSFIQPRFAEYVRLEEMLSSSKHVDVLLDALTRFQLHGLLSPVEQRRYILDLGGMVGVRSQTLAAAFGLEARQPMLDARLLEYCFGIPERAYWLGEDRGLYKRAFRCLLPGAILENPGRGIQAVDTIHRLRGQAERITELLDDLSRNSQVKQYVDVERMRSVWTEVQSSKEYGTHARLRAELILRGLAVTFFVG